MSRYSDAPAHTAFVTVGWCVSGVLRSGRTSWRDDAGGSVRSLLPGRGRVWARTHNFRGRGLGARGGGCSRGRVVAVLAGPGRAVPLPASAELAARSAGWRPPPGWTPPAYASQGPEVWSYWRSVERQTRSPITRQACQQRGRGPMKRPRTPLCPIHACISKAKHQPIPRHA